MKISALRRKAGLLILSNRKESMKLEWRRDTGDDTGRLKSGARPK
jgi:hypothetical protein